ncbi:hypothetical protein HPP92_022878 [Vanilla planifolia]|uniref:Uncharacterized protein n=1 Tax=Vanilla planifolia TaxID=51239 RepID=A0A835UFR2_VANPL|nr:hypothetical protein HPP92_022878 [Vanilla planifolia]
MAVESESTVENLTVEDKAFQVASLFFPCLHHSALLLRKKGEPLPLSLNGHSQLGGQLTTGTILSISAFNECTHQLKTRRDQRFRAALAAPVVRMGRIRMCALDGSTQTCPGLCLMAFIVSSGSRPQIDLTGWI